MLNYDIKTAANFIEELKEEIQSIENQIVSNTGRISSLKKKKDILKVDYEELLYYAYKTRNIRQKTLYILSAQSFNQAYRRFKYLQFFTDYVHTFTVDLHHMTDSLNTENINLSNRKKEKIHLREKQADEIIRLKKVKTTKKTIIAKLRTKKSKLQREIKKRKIRSNAITNSVQKQNKTQTDDKSPETVSFAQAKGKLPFPVNGIITSRFGKHRHPVYENVFIRNDGIEITASNTYDVKSVFKGLVKQIIQIPGSNKAVLVKHGTYYTVYANLSDVYVKTEQKIDRNTKIGKIFVNSTSDDSGVLNFQIWKQNKKLNPERWLK